MLLAVSTLMSHRAHTRALLQQTNTVDKWAFYQAKHGRAYLFAGLAEIATRLPNANDIAVRDVKKSLEEECGFPVEKGCSIPIRDSDELNQVMAAMKNQKQAGAKQSSGDEAHSSQGSPDAPEKHDSSQKEEHDAGKEGRTPKTKDGATKNQEQAEVLERKTEMAEEKANYYDGGELFLELSIVLCSISLLSDNKLYFKLSFFSSAVGVAFVLWGVLLH